MVTSSYIALGCVVSCKEKHIFLSLFKCQISITYSCLWRRNGSPWARNCGSRAKCRGSPSLDGTFSRQSNKKSERAVGDEWRHQTMSRITWWLRTSHVGTKESIRAGGLPRRRISPCTSKVGVCCFRRNTRREFGSAERRAMHSGVVSRLKWAPNYYSGRRHRVEVSVPFFLLFLA